MRALLPLLAGAVLGLGACSGTPESAPPAQSPPEDEVRAVPMRGPATPADETELTKQIEAVKQRIPPGRGFSHVYEAPFLVIGDESPRMVKRRATNTVGWAVRLLKKAYFPKDPDHLISVWLFRNRASYERHTKEIFGDEPDTPFGYYSPSERALVMNIATGGGTLVHEIVHPYVAANFPACPSWFNEGLGSLYEQCHERDGKIMGLTNWRLEGLQQAIRAGRLPSFEKLTATTTSQFYDEDPGTNYGQARYLLYWLQEKGRLRKYYKAFFAARREDPTGLATLKKTLGRDDIAAFQKEWEAWVLKLRFR